MSGVEVRVRRHVGHLSSGSDDLEQIDEAIDTSAVTAWEVLAALVIALIGWPISSLVDRVTRPVVRRISATPDYVPELAGRSARVLVLLIAAAWAMSLLGVDVGWFGLVIALVAVVAFLMIRPLAKNLAAGLQGVLLNPQTVSGRPLR